MPEHEDSLGGETFSGEEEQDPAEQSLGDGATMGGDTAAHSLGDQSTFGDANVDDELFDDGMKLEDLSERYTEEGVLGKGGMGEVILATDTRLGRKVAIKRILGKAARSKTAVARFLTEAKSMAELSHPNIVQIYDYGRATDGPFLIMECVQGGSLLDKCKAGPIELDEAVNIFGQLCDGLAKAHAAGIIHRDIKPANVLLTEDGVPKLTDFGLAKDDTADTGMTMEGAVIGTLDFMPPEQRQAAELTDHRSDLWSLAATFYQMLTGKSPKVINIAALPPKLQSVVAKALEESKDERFQSALEMKEAVLQAATAGLNASRDLGEGECPNCGTTNPSDRKFCRNTECASSLEVDCLSCKTAMPMWEGVCGSCGTKQDSLIEEAKEGLQRKHDEAEQFLNELKFTDALKAASVIGEQNDLRLQQFTAWHEEFSARIESSRTSEHARLEELLEEALAHEQAYDYEAGLQTLTQVAPSLKQTTVTGNKDTAAKIANRLSTQQSRLKELEGIARERVSKREIADLLPIVNELLTLKPDHPEGQKLKRQLEKRTLLLETEFELAQLEFDSFNDQACVEIVKKLGPFNELPSKHLELRKRTLERLEQVEQLKSEFSTFADDDAEAFPILEEYLRLRPGHQGAMKRLERLRPGYSAIASNRQQERRTSTTIKALIAIALLLVLFGVGVGIKGSMDAAALEINETEIREFFADGNYQTALVLDPDNTDALAMKKRAYKLRQALAYGDYHKVLGLDPGNIEGLRLQAAAEEKAAAERAAMEKAVADKAAASEKAAILARAPITNTIGMKLKGIPAGTFTMGSPESEADREVNETQHKVTISKAFYMQTTEVTQGQWQALMATEPWKGKSFVNEGDNYPAVYVSWDDAVAYCEKLSEKESVTYRLPTEAEWEYACRAGTETRWSFGNDEKALGDYAWYRENADDIDEKYAHQVELKKPNAFELYDMHGNVWEWCHDYFEEDYYKQSPEKDPTGPTSGSSRVFRGGSWRHDSRYTRSADRLWYDAVNRNYNNGFRLVRELD
jgi:sulfatase modifying factor 1